MESARMLSQINASLPLKTARVPFRDLVSSRDPFIDGIIAQIREKTDGRPFRIVSVSQDPLSMNYEITYQVEGTPT
jgi:hypothetical protein